jgi:hypothetical protein
MRNSLTPMCRQGGKSVVEGMLACLQRAAMCLRGCGQFRASRLDPPVLRGTGAPLRLRRACPPALSAKSHAATIVPS